MAFLRTGQQTVARADGAVHEGLRQFMLRVYNYMGAGLALTGLVAMLAASTPALLQMLYQVNAAGQIVGMTGFGWIIAFAPLAFTLFLSFRQHTMSLVAVQTWFWAFTVVMGLSMTSIFVMYTGASVARVFFITASVFGVMSIIGYTTKRDLTGMGSFLMMGLIGMLIAGVVNIFLQSPMMYFIMSLVGVVLAVGLTAYDTQKVKQVYFMLPSEQDAQKAAVLGAFTLYFDFIYLFINLMRLMGERR